MTRDGGGAPEAVVATSYEARWFFEGEIPGEVVRAFMGTAAGDAEWPRARTDRYLPFAADMGIKLRMEADQPALLEFKGRQRSDGPVLLTKGVVGRTSTWTKWSYPVGLAPLPLRQALTETGPAVSVVKRRLLRLFRLDAHAPAREVAPAERLSVGVQLELTRLRIPTTEASGRADREERRAWTLGFEGFPVGPGLEDAVGAALAAPLEALHTAGAKLDEGHSVSYPEWLAGLGPAPTSTP
jgi:hypothetical protein